MYPKTLLNLDVNASYGVDPAVKQGIRDLLEGAAILHNPSSIHIAGQQARALVEESRENLRLAINGSKDTRIIFTSGATEANNSLLEGVLSDTGLGALSSKEVIVSSLEHPSVLEKIKQLKARGLNVREIVPGRDGAIEVDSLLALITPKTALVSLMLANNESGAITNISELARALKRHAPDVIFHTDAAQAFGKIKVDFTDLAVDLMTLSGHKVGALSGVGALIARSGVSLSPFSYGGPQEKHLRAGTENVLGIASLGCAAKLVQSGISERTTSMERNRRRLLELLYASISEITLNSPSEGGLPNTINIEVCGVNADDLVVALDLKGILVSSGAACASGKPEPSHVLLGLGLSAQQARSSIRISLGQHYPEGALEYCAREIANCIEALRRG